MSLWSCCRRQRRTRRRKTPEEDVESLHSLQENLTKPTEEDVKTPKCVEDVPSMITEEALQTAQHVEEIPIKITEEEVEASECIDETSSKITEEDAGTPGHVEDSLLKKTEEDAGTPERVEETPECIEDSLTAITEEDTEAAEHIEETQSEPTEEDVETPQSLEESERSQPGEDVEVPQSIQESTAEDGGEEEAVYCDTLERVQIQQAADEGARWLGAEGDQLLGERTVSQYETCKSRTLKAGTLEKLVETLLMAFADNDFMYIDIFLSTYRAFASTSTVLELLLDRYGNVEISSCEEVGNQNCPESTAALRTAIASILQAWLDQCTEDFKEPPDYVCLMKVLDFLKKNIPGSGPERRAQDLLELFQKEELENDDGFHSCSSHNLDDELETSSPEEFYFFKEDLVAEQLTYMDVTLFKKVVPHHCLGCIWSRRDKKENEHLAQSIRATISQFNAVTNCVVGTILESKGLKTHRRAKILEKWIHIAHECRILKNYSSLKAIISALQSTSIYRLKKTWACIPKDVMMMFEELAEIFSDTNNFSRSRELLMKGVKQGTVPYLGTFLTDLVMLDTALQDYLEGGLINFEKRRREFEVIAQIKLLQSACNSYCMTPDEKFLQWFRRQQHLSDEESFCLSCEIEPAVNKSIVSTKSQRSVVKRFSLPFLGSGVIAHSTPVKVQPKPAAGGDSGDRAITIVTPTDTPQEPQHTLPETSSSSCTTDRSADASSVGVSSLILSPPLLPSAAKCSTKCLKSVTAVTCEEVPPVQPMYNQQKGDSCIIRTSVEEDRSGSIYKSILLTNQEKAAAVIQRAVEKHNLESGSSGDYELVQVMSADKELVIPPKANVFYAMNTLANFDFILRRKASAKEEPAINMF